MTCRHEHALPHAKGICLDCECLAPDKCVEHGPHEGHDIAIKDYEDGTHRWYCNTCTLWMCEQ